MEIPPVPHLETRRAAMRFPFVRPRMPAMERVDQFLALSRAEGYLSNFGPNSRALEHEVAAGYAPGWAVSACSSCTAGLSVALLALGSDGPVLIPAFTFPATASAVRGAGLLPVVADVDPGTGLIRPEEIERCVRTHGIAAVLAVRPYGIWTDLSGIVDACRRHGLPLVIDNASGFGVAPRTIAEHAQPGSIEVFSLHATKPAGIGEGGLLLHPPALAGAIRLALNFGMAPGTAEVCTRGINGKMDEIRAATARDMLLGLPARVRRRQHMAAEFGRLAAAAGVRTFLPPGQEWRAAWQCFPLRLEACTRMDAVTAECARLGLHVRRYYAPHLTDGDTALPGARHLAEAAMCLPIYDTSAPGLAEEMWDIFECALAAAG